MEGFFLARDVVVIGVSDSPNNLGQLIVHHLMEYKFKGSIHVVGPRGGICMGHRIHKSISDIPDPLDLAVLLVPASIVPEVLEQCGERGIKRVIVESAGFRELGEEKTGLELKVKEILKRYQMRMIGPNCLGTVNRKTGLAVPFYPVPLEVPLGRISIIAQSGGVGVMAMNLLEGENLGMSKFASIGNELDVKENDLLEYYGRDDDDTGLIYCYLEGISDGRRLMRTAFESRKPIIVHKSNTGATGSEIARSHSASLSSDDRVVDAALKQCGIIRTREPREAVELLKAFSLPAPRGNRLGIIARSGGHAVTAADAAEEYGFRLPPYPQDFFELIKERSRAHVIRFHNPLDVGDVFDVALYRTLIEKTLEREDIDGVIVIHNYQGELDVQESRRLIASLGELMERYDKPLGVCAFTTKCELDSFRCSLSFPIFNDPREAIRALAVVRDKARRKPIGFSTERPPGVDRPAVAAELASCPPGFLPPDKLGAVLSGYGIECVPWEKTDSEERATAAARRLGYPVVLKTAQPEVIHKSEAGGVHVNISNEVEFKRAYDKVRRLGASMLVQKMSGPGLEWLIGGRRDGNFGPVVVVGLGGIYVEVFDEIGIRVGPIGREEAGRLVDDCRGARLLRGVRGQPPLDRHSLEDVIVRISWLLNDFPEISELDLNPVRVFETGCRVLDWRAAIRRG